MEEKCTSAPSSEPGSSAQVLEAMLIQGCGCAWPHAPPAGLPRGVLTCTWGHGTKVHGLCVLLLLLYSCFWVLLLF